MDHHGAKGRQDVHHHSIIGKKSMKFANNYNSIGYSNDGSEGTMRGPSLSGRPTSGNTSQHHHIGRYGRGGHASLFDNDSLFPIATKSTRSAASQLHNLSTRHASSRNPQVVHVAKSSRKLEEILSYDLEGEGADDERTPLVGSVRVGRNRRRPLPGSVRQMYSENRGHNCCGRITAFIALGSSLALLIAAMVVIVVMCSKQLVDVHAKDIRNLLVSEQEIMLDLHVHAINPNLIAIQISDLDVNIFARSKHVGMSALRPSDHPRIMTEGIHSTAQTIEATSQDLPPLIETPSDVIPHFDGGVDEGTDPIDDPTTDSPKMLLGQIYEFDSPLVFDPSPISHRSFGSVGEVRLAKPGNKTEDGGTDRWEHVLQYDFELIIRGVLKYSLPISSKVQKAKISASTIVHAGEAIDNAGNVRITEPMRPLEPGGNVSVKGAGQGVRLRMKARS